MELKFKSGICLAILLLVLLFGNAIGQELSSESKKARKSFELAERDFRMKDYQQAEINFRSAVETDPLFFEAWVMLGELYQEIKQDSLAINAYRKAVLLNPDLYPPVFYHLAIIEFNYGYYEDALGHFSQFIEYEAITDKRRSVSEKNIRNCKFAINALENPVPFTPINLGPEINTNLNEYFPCLTADNQTLLFTRLLLDPESFTGRQEDFYITTLNDGEWLTARNIGLPINTMYNEGAPTLSADGNILIFTACESVNGYGEGRQGFGRCDLFMTELTGFNWSEPVNAGIPVNSGNWESQPCLAADGQSLYFVSNRNNNYDIWVTRKGENDRWTLPEMLSDNVNTSGYEGSVFIHPDNQTLYFSSDGHTGMGGMDIFYSRKDEKGDWGIPVNIGYPINTHRDENSILINSEGDLAMFASDREDGYGGLDLYQFELYKEARPQFVTYLKGKVYDKKTEALLKASFELTDLKTGEVAVKSFSNAGNGEFLVCIPTNRDYALNVSKKGYLFYSENFSLSGINSTTDPIYKDIPLNKIQVGKKVVLKNIFYEHDKFNLKNESKVELNKLVDLLAGNPDVRIEISGHTDNVGSPQYNLDLSQNRAKSVNDYLVSKGIAQSRLVYKGYGESKPIDTNDTNQGRANNRRTEVKVI